MTSTQFCKSMLLDLNNAATCYYPIRREFGHTLQNCSIDALMAYTRLCHGKRSYHQNLEFLVAGLCYNTDKPHQLSTKQINFEDALKRLNREQEVENFLKLRQTSEEYFAKRFMILAKKAIGTLQFYETFNYERLLNDLIYWNNNTKIRWAMAVVNYIDDENTNKEGNN